MSFERSCGLRNISCMCSKVKRHVLACASAIVLLRSSEICAGSENKRKWNFKNNCKCLRVQLLTKKRNRVWLDNFYFLQQTFSKNEKVTKKKIGEEERNYTLKAQNPWNSPSKINVSKAKARCTEEVREHSRMSKYMAWICKGKIQFLCTHILIRSPYGILFNSECFIKCIITR